ncbi:hypothetical protein F2Q69_00040649 [Brassica cretica]|uniref:Uncharacterized protein n=1 Tax=Brassica cretica TaxID=69181 RepID=A0A8S9NC48_BRACR|nr:hypothetical protein F2Q69_00040649 [Brassica cretica]
MGATSPERHREVAVTPFQSDLARATPRCRSRLHRSEARERLGQSYTIRGWNAYLEVWGEIQGLYCKVWKFWVHCDVNKNPGTKVANS